MIIDVSKWKGYIDWDKLAPSVEFCMIKASGKVTDPYYSRNAFECKRLGIPFHAYHFLYCLTEEEAKRDAKLFSDSVGDTNPLFWVLDCEGGWGISDSEAPRIARIFEEELRRLHPEGIRVALYVAQRKYKYWALDYGHYDYIWIPGYGEKYRPPYPHDIWQYTDKGTAPGIKGDVDLNVLSGTKPLSYFTMKSDPATEPTKEEGGIKMGDKMPVGAFVTELVAALNRKDGYIMGARGQNPRTGKLNLQDTNVSSSWKENGWYYTQYSGSQRTQALYWRSHCTRVWDCNGMAEGIYELYSGKNIDSKARYNYSQWCDPKGSGMIPAQFRIPGAAVFWSNSKASEIHHVAYLWKPVNEGHPEGDWYIIEAKGVMYGVVQSKLYSRKPNFWGLMTKYFDYGDAATTPLPPAQEIHLGDRILRNGCEGNDVQEMQTNLIRLGYDLGRWGADGDFGDATELAVRKFQEENGLEVDGEFGPKSLAMMEKLLSEETEAPVESPKTVRIVGGQCYVRSEPNTSGAILGVAKEGSECEYAGETSENGWLKVVSKGKYGWVSGKYGKLVN